MDSKKILIIDDEPDLREIIRDELKSRNFICLEAENGKKALEIFEKEKPDALISDIRMPGGDGIALLDQIRENHPTHPAIILITGYADVATEDAFAKGADAVFGKPFGLQELLTKLSEVLKPSSERWLKPFQESQIDHWVTLGGLSDLGIGRGGFFVPRLIDVPMQKPIGLRIHSHRAYGNVRWSRKIAEKGLPVGFGLEIEYLDPPLRAEFFAALKKEPTKACIPKS